MIVKYTYLKHHNKTYKLWDARDVGDMDCPKCGKQVDRLKRMDVQLGLFENVVTYFAVCSECKHHFVWRDTNMKKASKRMSNEALWADESVSHE